MILFRSRSLCLEEDNKKTKLAYLPNRGLAQCACIKISIWLASYLLYDSLDPVESLLQCLHFGPIAQSHEMMAGAIKQVSSLGWIEIEEDARDDNDALFDTFLEEV